jgi:hypothetical protein
MQVTDPTTVTSVNSAPVLPVTPLPTSAVSATKAAGRKSGGGQNAGQQAGYSSSRFRAALDAATVAGFGRISAAADNTVESATTSSGPPSRTPPASQEIDAEDTPELYQAARAYAAGASDSSSESESVDDEPTASPSPISLRYAQTAATRYAQSFFSVGGTFAARGDTLELSA